MRELVSYIAIGIFLVLFFQSVLSSDLNISASNNSGFLEKHGSSISSFSSPASLIAGFRGQDAVLGSTQSNRGPESFTQGFAVDGFIDEISSAIGFGGCQLGGSIWMEFSGSASCASNTLVCGATASQCSVVSCTPDSGYFNGSINISASAKKDFGEYNVHVCTDSTQNPSNAIQVKTVKGESKSFLQFDVSQFAGTAAKKAEIYFFVEESLGTKSLQQIQDFSSLDSSDWAAAPLSDVNSDLIPSSFTGRIKQDVTQQLNSALESNSSTISFMLSGNGLTKISFDENAPVLSYFLGYAPDVNVTYPDVNSFISGTARIFFQYSDLDENQQMLADIFYRTPENAQLIAQDLNLNDSGVCSDEDNNTATGQQCFFDWNSFSLNDGNAFIDVNVKDSLQHTINSSPQFAVDNNAPGLQIIFPIEGQEFSSDSVSAEFDANDSLSGLNFFEVRLDSGEWQNNDLNSSTQFSGLSNGIHSISVKAWDKAGNFSEKTVSFSVNVPAPEEPESGNGSENSGGGGEASGGGFSGGGSAPARRPPEPVVPQVEPEIIPDENAVLTEPEIDECVFIAPQETKFSAGNSFSVEAINTLTGRHVSFGRLDFLSSTELKFEPFTCGVLKVSKRSVLFSHEIDEWVVEFVDGKIARIFRRGEAEASGKIESAGKTFFASLLPFPPLYALAVLPLLLALFVVAGIKKKKGENDAGMEKVN